MILVLVFYNFSTAYAVGIFLCPAAGLKSCENTAFDRTLQPGRGLMTTYLRVAEHTFKLPILGLALMLPTCVVAQESRPSRLNGYVGGPYKIVAADFTGDSLIDVVLGYHRIGVVSVEQGNGQGQLSPLALNVFSNEDQKIKPSDESWSEPHVHNMAYGDVDRDGLVDLIVAVGGLCRGHFPVSGRRLEIMRKHSA